MSENETKKIYKQKKNMKQILIIQAVKFIEKNSKMLKQKQK